MMFQQKELVFSCKKDQPTAMPLTEHGGCCSRCHDRELHGAEGRDSLVSEGSLHMGLAQPDSDSAWSILIPVSWVQNVRLQKNEATNLFRIFLGLIKTTVVIVILLWRIVSKFLIWSVEMIFLRIRKQHTKTSTTSMY